MSRVLDRIQILTRNLRDRTVPPLGTTPGGLTGSISESFLPQSQDRCLAPSAPFDLAESAGTFLAAESSSTTLPIL
jgi:hypothetical protein